MGAALGFALLQPPAIGMSIFLALGLGLAFPYLLLCAVPRLRKSLPKPGPWMETFKEFLAFPMFASAAWLIWVYSQQSESFYAVLLALSGIIFIALAVWFWRKAPQKNPAKIFFQIMAGLSVFLALSIAAGSSVMTKPLSAKEPANAAAKNHLDHGIEYTEFTEQDFENRLEKGEALFVNMTASWCITCKVNEKIALSGPETEKLFKDHNVTYIIGDWTKQNPDITKFLSSYGRSGVPLYVYFAARDPQTGLRPDPVVLPQLLTPGLVAETILNP
jgi:thiol:disulfide interchange protein DsbD